MKKSFLVLLLLCIIVSCSNDDNNGNSNEVPTQQYVVDKIYDYNNNLMGAYFYNENNQLIKKARIIDGEEVAKHEFEYSNGRVDQIDYENYLQPSFNHTIYIFYNEESLIIKDETHSFGNIIEINNYSHNVNGQIIELAKFSEGFNTLHRYNYNNTENIVQKISLLPEFDDGGNPTGSTIEVTFEYEYDQGLKPNFGIGNVFQIEPLPAFGTEALFVKNMSTNNMIRNHDTGTQWVYTYNENNLVETIETIWNGIETEVPIVLNITYKEVN